MAFQIIFISICPPTFLTHKRLDPRVHVMVIVHMISLGESHPADVTNIRFLACVNTHVSVQVKLETFTAHRTLEWCLACVRTSMC